MPIVIQMYRKLWLLGQEAVIWFYVCREAVLQRHAQHNNLAAYYFVYYHFMHASSANI